VGNNLGRFANVQRLEYPSGAEPIGARVLFTVGYAAPSPHAAPNATSWDTKWWAKAIAITLMLASAVVPATVAIVAP
jgi:hypothetical protein